MRVKFWGVRGSISVPGPSTLKYGGNGSCVEITTHKNRQLILDAGTGIRELGLFMMKQKKKYDSMLLLSHAHMDHVNGFPFFAPAYVPSNHFTVMGCATTDKGLRHMLAAQMGDVYFPLEFDGLGADMEFHDYCKGGESLGDCTIEVHPTNHPGGGLSYKIIEKKKCVIYMTDNELGSDAKDANSFDSYVEFCKGADLLIHDTQYTPAQYKKQTKGWGHSTTDDVARLATAAGVKKLVIFHHDPERTDKGVEMMRDMTLKGIKKRGGKSTVVAAREKTVITVE